MKHRKWYKQLAFLTTWIVFIVFMTGCTNPIVLDPKGPIGDQQRDLIWFTIAICIAVLIPVLGLTAFIIWRYRDKADNKAPYHPDWEHSTKLETIWWGIPILIIIVLGTVTVKYTYDLVPAKPIASEKKAITIQATALDWKWLFTYPDQGIATVNYLQIPEDVPIRFELTADAPMNSFWIPQLGGQLYAMSGMSSTLYLQADEIGEYLSSGANFSGEHFGKMTFNTKATSQADFDAWVNKVKLDSPVLTIDGYKKLSQKSVEDPLLYSAFPNKLYEKIVTKYSAHYNHELSYKEPNSKPSHDHKMNKEDHENMDQQLEDMPAHHGHH
ncbi:cytochrome C oxidase subunit II [Paenibacillus swuensis]|uniref:Quinol oxidase subunit 2 n=1 Tax=Paenibacillus swuensis TaxID=1178515 RepID=A0A172TL26_9BACL|nr:cytochrome aa3 quinol oxidase subunit II [Paenibacillus swuensis]ANE47730.1 cytochrome C oxidase subunit II [Paenibacillus swuensis]